MCRSGCDRDLPARKNEIFHSGGLLNKMKKELKNKLIFISGVVFALALLFVSVQLIQAGWTAPTAPFPGGTVYPPIDSGPDLGLNKPVVRSGSLQLDGKAIQNGTEINGVGSVIKIPDGRWIGTDTAFILPKTAAGNMNIFSTGALTVNTKGFILPKSVSTSVTSADSGMIYYDTVKKGVKLYDGTGWKDIGSGSGVLKPTVILTGNSGSIGMILNKDSNDTSGTNSPILVFDGFGAPKVGLLEQKNANIFSSLFRVDQAHATVLPCDNSGVDAVTACGGGGGSGGSVVDGLTQPIWWMRQQGTSFSIMASDPTLQDLRYSLTLTKGGGVLAGGPNNSVIPGNGEFFEYRKSLGNYVQTAPSGMWCGLNAEDKLRWRCSGYDPGNDGSPCPIGWKQAKFGKGSFGGAPDWKTCIKL